MARFSRVFRFGDQLWDPSHRFETSWLLPPWVLFAARAAISLYAFVVLLFIIGWEYTRPAYGGVAGVQLSFSFFTVLCYWGLSFYFLVAAIHTFSYALHGGTPLLNRFPRPLQALHHLFYTTITTFPFLVTIVYWGVLFSGPWFPLRFNAWSNISEHAMNSGFALFEISMTRVNPPPWIHLLWLILILCCYLGLAYLTHYTKGIYVYSFLDPSNGHKGRVVGYVFGIAAAIIIIFSIVKGLIHLRKLVTEKKMGRTGKFYGGRGLGTAEIELETQRVWEK
ncbi:hypothetical protein PVAG01_06351 [Phlyctema vagabunda]|uniref:FAR-17a/AIG1-like protein n=1 Tax=Phlyctema vagabunda TaxID=108571 RepID=A0ABR4PG04_9HELO